MRSYGHSSFLAYQDCPYLLQYNKTPSCSVTEGYISKALARGGSLGSEEPPQSEKGPPKGPLECTKRSTRLHKKVHLNVQKGPLLQSA